MIDSSAAFSASGSPAGREFRRLELERGADVYRLAVAAVVLQRRKSVALDIVADAAGQRDAVRQRIRGAGIKRHIIAAAQCSDRIARDPLRTHSQAGAQPVV